MIKVTVVYENDLITSIQVKGHANYAEYGKDIVCAGISAITIGMINSINELDKDHYNVINKNNDITFIFDNNEKSQLLANTLLIQYKTVEESYSENVKIIIK